MNISLGLPTCVLPASVWQNTDVVKNPILKKGRKIKNKKEREREIEREKERDRFREKERDRKRKKEREGEREGNKGNSNKKKYICFLLPILWLKLLVKHHDL